MTTPTSTPPETATALKFYLSLTTLAVTLGNSLRHRLLVSELATRSHTHSGRRKTYDILAFFLAGMVLGVLVFPKSGFRTEESYFGSIFFSLFLPPIAFEASLNEERTSLSGVLFSLLGTPISAFLIGTSLEYIAPYRDGFPKCFRTGACLIWGIISAAVSARFALPLTKRQQRLDNLALTGEDVFVVSGGREGMTVTRPSVVVVEEEEEEDDAEEDDDDDPLARLSRKEESTLFSWIHTESLVSGPVAIAIFTSLISADEDSGNLGAHLALDVLAMFFGSSGVGILCGMFSALSITDANRNREEIHTLQVSLVVFWTLAAFFASSFLGYSPPVALFACGFVMSRTALHAMNEASRLVLKIGLASIAEVCEAFVYVYVGGLSSSLLRWSVPVAMTAAEVLFVGMVVRLVVALVSTLLLRMFSSSSWAGGDENDALPGSSSSRPPVFPRAREFFTVITLSGLKGVTSMTLLIKSAEDDEDLLSVGLLLILASHVLQAPLLARAIAHFRSGAGAIPTTRRETKRKHKPAIYGTLDGEISDEENRIEVPHVLRTAEKGARVNDW